MKSAGCFFLLLLLLLLFVRIISPSNLVCFGFFAYIFVFCKKQMKKKKKKEKVMYIRNESHISICSLRPNELLFGEREMVTTHRIQYEKKKKKKTKNE